MKTALITGASGGIGYELAKIFAKNGNDLVLAARSQDKLKTIKKELEGEYKVKVDLYPADLSVAGSAMGLYEHCQSNHIVIDYLINNAGYGDYKSVVDADPEVLSNMLRLNIITLTELTTLFVKDMVKRNDGRILNIGSTAAYQPVPRLAAYAASKAYVVSFSEALHAELKKSKVSVTVLSPGVTATGFIDRAGMAHSANAQGTQAEPAKVANAGYRAMLKGKLYVIPGLLNKLMALGSRMMPSRSLVLAVADSVSKEQKGRS